MMVSQTIKEKFVELQRYIDSEQTPQNSQPKIQRVPHYLRNRNNFEKHYTPKLVSIGPIHHGNTDLKLGEKYKLMWAAEYIKNTGSIQKDLHKKIADNIDELKGHFSDDVLTLTGNSLQGFECLEEKLSWMLFVDGCSLLHIFEKNMPFEDDDLNIKIDQFVLVMMDVLLLENQLPYQVLKLLWKDNESKLIKRMKSIPSFFFFLESQSEKEKEKEGKGEHRVSIPNESPSETPTHLLDLQRKTILTTSNSKTKSNEAANKKRSRKLLQKIKKWSQKEKNFRLEPITYRGIEDLRAVGIRLESTMNRRPTEIDFSEGWFTAKLTIPMIHVNNFTASTLLNLIAYEMCPDFDNGYEICSYVALMDSLINHPEDVKELRSKDILCTSWSDEEVASLFNIMGANLAPNIDNYFKVRRKLREHYFNKYKTWIALGYRTYFNNPWAVIAFLAAFIALALTFIQTLFTVHPASK